MLIRFSIENWMSFRDRVTFSMIASRERQHGERVPKIDKYRMRVLPVAAIYGGNASGKTNLFKALNFAKSLVVKGVQIDGLIPVETFRLDSKQLDQPTRFTFELLIDENIYEFSFAVTRKAILEERLVRITSTNEKVLYNRQKDNVEFDPPLDQDEYLEFVSRGTRDNQLFLTNSISQKVENFQPIYNWFKDSLELIAPDSRFEPFEQFLDKDSPLHPTMNKLLLQLDTGIVHLGAETIPLDNIPHIESYKSRLQEDVSEDTAVRLPMGPNHRYIISRENGELNAQKLVTYHLKSDGTETKFEMHQESDGSQRIIDLLPAFLDISEHKSPKVFVIDEIDRSLHTLLTRQLLESYLNTCSTKTRSQLLLTTHDVLLMDQQLLRRDEMWIAERDALGVSYMISFSEYEDIRYDKDIRKSYLQGRMGGIPRILLGGALTNPCLAEESGEIKDGVEAKAV